MFLFFKSFLHPLLKISKMYQPYLRLDIGNSWTCVGEGEGVVHGCLRGWGSHGTAWGRAQPPCLPPLGYIWSANLKLTTLGCKRDNPRQPRSKGQSLKPNMGVDADWYPEIVSFQGKLESRTLQACESRLLYKREKKKKKWKKTSRSRFKVQAFFKPSHN